jgi:hypothetical protein
MNFETKLISEIFESLEGGGEEYEDQSVFIKILNDIIFQPYNLGDEKISQILIELFTKNQDYIWAQCLIVSLI